jgi:DNA-directed DNA polymerase
MINIDRALSEGGFKTKMLLQVHDELLFEVPEEEIELIKALIKEKMESAVKTKVPLIVEVGVGNNWLEAH